MTGNRAKICTTEEKSPVEVRRKNAKMLGSRRISVFFGAFLGRVRTVLMARRVEIEAPIVVLLSVWRAGTLIMKLNGKSRIEEIIIIERN